MAQASQGYVSFSFDEGGNLVMTPTPDGVEEAKAYLAKGDVSDNAFLAMIEDSLGSGWELVQPEEVGALTSALIITNDAERDDQGKLLRVGTVWSNIEHYQVSGEVEAFAAGEPVTWKKADAADGKVVEAKKKGKPVTPWAVCNKSLGKGRDPDKFERCVMDVKEKHPVKKSDEEAAREVLAQADRDSIIRLSSEVVRATDGDGAVVTAFEMAVDLANEGVGAKDSVLKIAEATGMAIATAERIRSAAVAKMDAHVSDAYAVKPAKAEADDDETPQPEIQQDALELGLVGE